MLNVCDLKPYHVTTKYREIPPEDVYKVDIVKELIEVGNRNLEVAGFSGKELDELLHYLCVS